MIIHVNLATYHSIHSNVARVTVDSRRANVRYVFFTAFALQLQFCHCSMVTQVVGRAFNTSFHGRLPVSLGQLRSSIDHHVEDDADVVVNHPAIPQTHNLVLESAIDWLSGFNCSPPLFIHTPAATQYPQDAPKIMPIHTALGNASVVTIAQLPHPRHVLFDQLFEVGLRQLRKCLGA